MCTARLGQHSSMLIAGLRHLHSVMLGYNRAIHLYANVLCCCLARTKAIQLKALHLDWTIQRATIVETFLWLSERQSERLNKSSRREYSLRAREKSFWIDCCSLAQASVFGISGHKKCRDVNTMDSQASEVFSPRLEWKKLFVALSLERTEDF